MEDRNERRERDPVPTQHGLQRYLEDLATHADLHGMLAVFAGGQVLAQRAYGFADVDQGIRNTVETRFPIGSLSKGFTAAAVLALGQRGLLDIDAPAAGHLPACGLDARITLRHLLVHQSGLANHTALQDYWPVLMQTPHAPEELVRRATAVPLLHAPGQGVHYSNTGYAALARVAEQVGGQPLHELLASLFWAPLGLGRTTVLEHADTTGHLLDTGRPRAPWLDPSVAHGAYGLAAAASDLARWWWSLVSGQVLDERHRATMFDGPAGAFGCGWWLDGLELSGRRWRSTGHRADVNGHTAMLLGLPEAGLCSVVLFNTASTPAAATARRLLGLALGEHWDPYPPALPRPAGPGAENWATGSYRAADGTPYRIDAAQGTASTLRDYGVPCCYAIEPSALAPDRQAWRAQAFDERLDLCRAEQSLAVTGPDGVVRRFLREP